VVVVAIAGFFLGWLWYSPVLFAKSWMAEMKISPESIKEGNYNMPKLFGTALILTLMSTFALAWLITALHSESAFKGEELGAMVGLLLVGTRLTNGGLWEQRSCRLLAITIGHEVVLFTMQGAILAAWR